MNDEEAQNAMQLLATAAHRLPRRVASIAASSARRLPRHHGFAAAATSAPSALDTYLPFTTIPELARRATQRFADNPAFGTLSSDGKDIDYITYRDLGRRIARCRAGLVNAGVSAGDRVGIISSNRRYRLYQSLVCMCVAINRSDWAVAILSNMHVLLTKHVHKLAHATTIAASGRWSRTRRWTSAQRSCQCTRHSRRRRCVTMSQRRHEAYSGVYDYQSVHYMSVHDRLFILLLRGWWLLSSCT